MDCESYEYGALAQNPCGIYLRDNAYGDGDFRLAHLGIYSRASGRTHLRTLASSGIDTERICPHSCKPVTTVRRERLTASLENRIAIENKTHRPWHPFRVHRKP
jgi:hypothetical protein